MHFVRCVLLGFTCVADADHSIAPGCSARRSTSTLDWLCKQVCRARFCRLCYHRNQPTVMYSMVDRHSVLRDAPFASIYFFSYEYCKVCANEIHCTHAHNPLIWHVPHVRTLCVHLIPERSCYSTHDRLFNLNSRPHLLRHTIIYSLEHSLEV
jgi:hypothetical protein